MYYDSLGIVFRVRAKTGMQQISSDGITSGAGSAHSPQTLEFNPRFYIKACLFVLFHLAIALSVLFHLRLLISPSVSLNVSCISLRRVLGYKRREIRSRKSKERKHNSQMKKDKRTNNDLQNITDN
jgi:hypothetical protein